MILHDASKARPNQDFIWPPSVAAYCRRLVAVKQKQGQKPLEDTNISHFVQISIRPWTRAESVTPWVRLNCFMTKSVDMSCSVTKKVQFPEISMYSLLTMADRAVSCNKL